jgi:hypothetical protein
MAMEKEALTHKIEDDLAARNRNWDKVDDLEAAHAAHLAEGAYKAHGGFKGAMVRKSANQSIPSGTNTPVTWQTAIYDTSGIYNPSNPTRLTVPAGVTKVRLAAQIVFGSNATGKRDVLIQKNGSLNYDGRATTNALPVTGTSQTMTVNITSPVLEVTQGDYFEILVYQNSGGSLTVDDWWTTWAALEVVE